jgi:glycosyltransferase involved in cell wall biosynthesis
MLIKKLHFISATFPPRVCGVGDYTARLSTELAKQLEVKVLTAYGNISNLPNVEVEQTFKGNQPRSIFAAIDPIVRDKPDWVAIQYDPFSYGARYGFNPYLPLAVGLLKHRCPQVRVVLIVHESFVPVRHWKSAILSTWLVAQLWTLSNVADAIFAVTESWVRSLKKWFPNKTIEHLPVASAIPRVSVNPKVVRQELGMSPKTIVIGLFGRMKRICNLDYVIQAVARTREAGFEVAILYMGIDSDEVRDRLQPFSPLAYGVLTPLEISQKFAAMDIFLLPLHEGISTRRTALMTGLQHGVAIVATSGQITDSVLLQENGKAFLLADANDPDSFADAVLQLASDPVRRKSLSEAAQELYERKFNWNLISSKFLTVLESCFHPEDSKNVSEPP